MAADPQCYGTLDFCMTRIALLNSSGQVVAGASNGWRTDGGIKLDIGPDVEAGDDLVQKNGCGLPALTWQDFDRIKRFNLQLDVSLFEPGFLGLALNNSTFMQSGSVLGTQAAPVDTAGNLICLEGWTKAWNGANQAGPALLGSGGNPITKPSVAYWHWVFPKVAFRLDKWSLNHAFGVFPLIGTANENPNMSAHGPFNDWPTGVVAAGGVVRAYGAFFDATLPASNCGLIAVSGASS